MPIDEARDSDQLPQKPPDIERWRAYRTGMRCLGAGLIVLSALQLVAGALIVLVSDLVLGATMTALGAIHFLAGILLLLRQRWVNYLVAVWGLWLAGVHVAFFATRQVAGTSGGNWLGIVIAVALTSFAIRNLKLYNRAAALEGLGN